jgi:hypothetical protein
VQVRAQGKRRRGNDVLSGREPHRPGKESAHSPLRIRPDYGIHALMRQDGFRNITLHPFLSHLPETVPPDETPSAVSGPDKKFQI